MEPDQQNQAELPNINFDPSSLGVLDLMDRSRTIFSDCDRDLPLEAAQVPARPSLARRQLRHACQPQVQTTNQPASVYPLSSLCKYIYTCLAIYTPIIIIIIIYY